MTKWAAKYFSHEDADTQKQIWSRLPPNHSLELGAYREGLGNFSPDMQTIIRNTPSFQKVLHHHHSIGVSSLLTGDAVPKFEAELLSCKSFGIQRSVLHTLSNEHFALFQTHHLPPEELCEHMLPFFRRANSQDVTMHLENVYEDPSWMKRFFAQLDANEFKVGFCLDIGHARAFSKTSLEEWTPLLTYLHEKGVSLHFHIHGNDGSKDMHLPMGQAESLGYLAPSEWAPRGVAAWLAETTKAYPQAIFCLKNKTTDVEDAFAWVRTHLS